MALIGLIAKKPFEHEGRSYVPDESLEAEAIPAALLLGRGLVRFATKRDRLTPIAGAYRRADMTPAKPATKRKPRTYKRKDLTATVE